MAESYLTSRLQNLRPNQERRILKLLESLLGGVIFDVNPASDFATEDFALEFGDLLLFHHNASSIPMTKDKFEYAMVDALLGVGIDARKLPNGNPGADIVVSGVPWSLKTQADAQIKFDRLHISKFMELGRGAWESIEDIELLRQRMFDHMQHYERIMTLRNLRRAPTQYGEVEYTYELVEIPKSLLMSSKNFSIEIKAASRQNPKPASCFVLSADGEQVLELYFDGGTERKLQIKSINKAFCVVHATWHFSTIL